MKRLKWLVLIIIILVTGSALIYYPTVKRLIHTINLFNENVIVENFQSMFVDYDAQCIEASPIAFKFPSGQKLQLPESFVADKEEFSVQQYLDSSFTTGFLVINDDSLVFEKYYLGVTDTTQWISWSMAKSFVSALFGIAVEEGKIKSIEQKVEEYCPELIGSGYEGVRIKDVLQMSTGVGFNEDYGDFYSDINKWGRGFALGKSQDKFATGLIRELEPGTVNHYVSVNTHVLGMIIVKATGVSLSQYLKEKIWDPLGMEKDAYWLIDCEKMEVALGGLNVCMRDYAKMGQLYLHKGEWNGKQLISKEWIKASITPDAPHLMPRKNIEGLDAFGYGYQWWIPEGNEGEFMAVGVYSQNIYVNPVKKVVIVKLSANHRYNEKNNPYANTKVALELFRSIANNVNK